ncbi:MAG TPA: hypothetical protein VD947_03195 [Patescibacteria group bacterium]|nr:hypothetical protein [Patescibacteria group bacterium]
MKQKILLIKKRKKIIVIGLGIILVTVLLLFIYFTDKQNRHAAIVLRAGYGYQGCTLDFPSSSCGRQEIKVRFKNGDEKILYVPGFNDGQPDPVDVENKKRLIEAKESGEEVRIIYEGFMIKRVN